MPSTVTLKASGLQTSNNQLDLPDGALSDASNVIISRQGVIEPRRGFKLFGTAFGTLTDTLKQVFVYKNRIIRHFQSILQFDSGTVTNSGEELFEDFSGSYSEAQEGLRIKSVESNGNLYFTTSEGIKKISVLDASGFSTAPNFITQAGGIAALDVTSTLELTLGNTTGFLPQDSAVAYRIVWGIRDANQNEILGAPSQRSELYNPLINLLIGDFNTTIQAIQNTANQVSPNNSIIKATDYSSTLTLSPNSSPNLLRTNLISLASKLDADLLFANDGGTAPLTISAVQIVNNPPNNLCTVTFSSGNPSLYFVAGSNIYLTGFPTGEGSDTTTNFINGAQIVSAVTSTTLSFITAATGNAQIFVPSNVLIITPWTVTITSHGFNNGDPVQFTNSGGALPAPLVAGTVYYIGAVTTDTFQVYSDSSLTTQVQFTTQGTGTHTVTYFMTVINTSINSNEFRFLTQPVIPATPATDDDLVSQQTYLGEIFEILQTFSSTGTPPIISSYSQTNFISPLTLTTTANANVYIDIPPDVTSSYFFQIYRSPIIQATGVAVLSELTPSDELQLVYEAFPTTAELAAGMIHVLDITPEAFAGADLYTNASSGEGLANANAAPPFALDINRFKNVVFYANTRTKYLESLSLLGVSKMITDFNNGITPTLTISDGITTNTYSFVEGVNQVTNVTTVADASNSLNGTYFLINSANDLRKYYVWYATSGGSIIDPAVSGRTGIAVFINTNDSDAVVATETSQAINNFFIPDFTSTVASNVVTITNSDPGYTANPSAGTSGFSTSVVTSGVGQRASTNQVLLSNQISPAKAVDATAQSLVQVINQNSSSIVNALYLSGAGTIPGQFSLQSRNLNAPQFYTVANNSNTGSSFSPDISPKIAITSISTSSVVTTATPHGLTTGKQAILVGTDSTPNADGLRTVTFLSSTTFKITLPISVAGTTGMLISADDAVAGSNEAKINRIYYSKIQQPEAVPLANTLDIGAADKAILRIFPLRDSLFVLKEDGVYRVSGETAPWNVALFDSSCILTAPDSVSITNNYIYAWTTSGIVTITESGVSNPPISRPIDVNILKLGSANYPNFSTATWGVGYNSDNSYIVYTVKNPDDELAQIGYRYSNLTNTWTYFDKSATCGVVNPATDSLYLGAGDINFLEQERKTFSRLDYADREFVLQLTDGNYSGSTIKFADVSDIEVGDVLVQTQNLNIFQYNSLLQKLDIDSGLLASSISAITTGFFPLVTTTAAHFLSTGNQVHLTSTNTTPNIDGLYTVTVVNSTQFSLSQVISPVLTAGTAGFVRYNYYSTNMIGNGASLETGLIALTTRLDVEPSLVNDYSALVAQHTGSISAISVADPTVITSTAHGLITGRFVQLSSTNSAPTIDGQYSVTVIDANNFSVDENILVAGTAGAFVTLNDSFQDLLTVYNTIIDALNNDTGTNFKNYSRSTGTSSPEDVVTSVNRNTKTVIINTPLSFVIGPMTLYKAIPTTFTYSPLTFKDTLSLKQVYEATLMFDNKAFTQASLSFASDLIPKFTDTPFNGDGNGIFGIGTGPFGGKFFGGNSNGAPFRTYIPRDNQRCRYIIARFSHRVAREKYSINGLSLTANTPESTRAYR